MRPISDDRILEAAGVDFAPPDRCAPDLRCAPGRLGKEDVTRLEAKHSCSAGVKLISSKSRRFMPVGVMFAARTYFVMCGPVS